MNGYIWQSQYNAVKFETQPAILDEKIVQAEKAILDRVEDGLHGRCELDTKERDDIKKALTFLRLLRRACAA